MAFDATSFKKSLTTSLRVPVKPVVKAAVVAKAAPSVFGAVQTSDLMPGKSTSANSTPQAFDTAKDRNIFQILDPRQKMPVRPLFGRAGKDEVETYGGPVVTIAHDVAARTIETIPSFVLKVLANYSGLAKGGTGAIKLPLDISRLGMEDAVAPELAFSGLSGTQADAMVAQLKSQGKAAIVKPNFETEKMDVYIQPTDQVVKSSGARAMAKLAELDAKHPDRQATNIVLAFLEPVFDVLDATIVGDLGVMLAKQGLSATRYTPGLDKALQQYGLKNTTLTGDALTNEINRKFRQKAIALAEAEDKEGMNELGEATNILLTHLSGRGIPQLSRLGQLVQDASRLALQKPREGFVLKHPMYPELSPEKPVSSLPGTVEEAGQGAPMGMSTKRVKKAGGADEPSVPATTPKPEAFEGFKDLSTKLLGKLVGRTTVSKQFIEDLSKSSDIKKSEQELLHRILKEEGDNVDVAAFAEKVHSELLPLERGNLPSSHQAYEDVNLPRNLRGPVADYYENIYKSPIKVSAGGVHFHNSQPGAENYFAHTRVEDLPREMPEMSEHYRTSGRMTGDDTFKLAEMERAGGKNGKVRRVIELQSDLFQKGKLEGERPIGTKYNAVVTDSMKADLPKVDARNAELDKLEPYRNTWWERIIREEVKHAAKDGKTKLQFPTGETAMKIEGLGTGSHWYDTAAVERIKFEGGNVARLNREAVLSPDSLRVGQELTEGTTAGKWVVTDVLGDGKFKAMDKRTYEQFKQAESEGMGERYAQAAETFDISGKVDTDNPIYKFYEKSVQRYLTNKYGGKRVKDAQGVEWTEIDITPEHGRSPVEAYGIASGVQEDDDGNIKFNPLMAILGIAGSGIARKVLRKLTPDLMKAAAKGAGVAEYESILTAAGIRKDIAKIAAVHIFKGMTEQDLDSVIATVAAAKNPPKNITTVTPTDEESYELMADQTKEWKYDLAVASKETEAIDAALTDIFAELKGVDAKSLDEEFTEEDLDNARAHYDIVMETLLDHPGRGLLKFRSRKEGEFFGDLKDPRTAKTDAERVRMEERNERIRAAVSRATAGRSGVSMEEYLNREHPDFIPEQIADYVRTRDRVREIKENLTRIRTTIHLQKARDEFVDSSKRVLAAEVAKNVRSLRNLLEAAEKAGYRKGVRAGNKKVTELVSRLKSRRTQITAIQKIYDLTDSEMRKIRGDADPRFMSQEEFTTYLGDLEAAAHAQNKRNAERTIIDAIISEKNLKKAENLQRALEFPSMKEMTLEQLVTFGDILAKTEEGDTFLGPRMIQTAKNTDLGEIKTIGDGIKAIEKQSGMPASAEVPGSRIDRWLRDSTLAEKDPLHKLFITEWAAREAQMLTRKYALNEEINTLASAARKSRRAVDASRRKTGRSELKLSDSVVDFFIPQDRLVVQWLQPFVTSYDDQGKKIVTRAPELRTRAEMQMTAQELKYAKFLEKFFSHYYDLAAQESLARWTLLGVKRSNYKDVYFAHISRSFLERVRDDGFWKGFQSLLAKETSDAKIDFNAFGDRGEVLGYEKWLNRNMTREGEGIQKETGKLLYTQNTAKVAMAYFHAFERKLILDSMVPKIKLLEFLMGKRFQSPKSITNPEGTEQVHSKLRKHINEWINNKKGQRIEMIYDQGSPFEKVMDAFRTILSLKFLGINLIAQVISGAGNTVVTMTGLGVKDWAIGARRMRLKKGNTIAKNYKGIIGESPWTELASAANDAGDILRSGAFYLFGELSYRARKQMMLGLLTKDEFETGIISQRRIGEIKLEIGKWHALPEQRSIGGSTSAAKSWGLFTEWAMPILQNTYGTVAPRLLKLIRSTPKEERAKLFKSKEFMTLFRLFVGGAATASVAYFLLDPDQNDHSLVGYMRRKAAQEISTLIQTVTVSGIPIPGSVMVSFIDQARNAIGVMLSLQRYSSSGDGYKEGDLKGPRALYRVFTPTFIQQAATVADGGLTKESTGSKSGSSKSGSAKSKLPALRRLAALKKRLAPGNNPALGRLKSLKKRLKLH